MSVGAQRLVEQAVTAFACDADGRGTAQQRAEQVAARLQRVVEAHSLTCEQQRLVEARIGERLGSEPLRVRNGCLSL